MFNAEQCDGLPELLRHMGATDLGSAFLCANFRNTPDVRDDLGENLASWLHVLEC